MQTFQVVCANISELLNYAEITNDNFIQYYTVQWVYNQIYVIPCALDTIHCLHLDTRLTKNYDGSWKKVVEFEEMNDSFFDE